LRLLHLVPGVGVALAGDLGTPGGQISGAIAKFQGQLASSPQNPAQALAVAGTEFTDALAVAYTGYKPSTQSYIGGAYPYRTYGAHFAIELTRFLVKKLVKGRSYTMGPFKFP
jgi:hypothetical protein